MDLTNGMPPRHDPSQYVVTKHAKNITLEDLMSAEELKQKQVNEEALRLYYEQQKYQPQSAPLIKAYTANEWMRQASQEDIPCRLFDALWYERDVCILFADTNLGKSILAVQIADSISRGVPIPGFTMDAPAQPVVYFDFELHSKQFEARYTRDYQEPYVFSPHFVRAQIDHKVSYEEWGFKTYEKFLHDQIAEYMRGTDIKVLIIDNLSALCTETEQSKDAVRLMAMLNELQGELNLSILVVAHTPKRDYSRPLTENDLQGSKAISNLCDSIMAIGRNNTDHRQRYLKQIKSRYGEKKYEADNVCVFQISKPHNFVQFELLRHSDESEQIRVPGEKEKGNLIASVKDLHDKGKSQREIARDLGISVGAVNKYLNA